MCKRSLSLMIAAALFGAGTVAAQSSEPLHQRSTQPPPAAAASMSGQTHVPGQQPPRVEERCAELMANDPALDYDACVQREESYAANAKASLEAKDADVDHDHSVLRDERIVEEQVVMEGDFDEVGVREGAVAGTDADAWNERRDDTMSERPMADGTMQSSTTQVAASEGQPEVVEGEMKPFAETAGTEGFSTGATASAAEREFERLGDGSDELTREQLQGTELAERFDEYDINNDGRIAENEFQSWFAATNAAEQDDTASRTAATGDDMDAADMDADESSATDATTRTAASDPQAPRDYDQTAEADIDVDADLDDADVDVDVDAEDDID